MVLIVDVGNTLVKIAVFKDGKNIHCFNFLTPKNGDFEKAKELIANNLKKYNFNDVYVSSVAPSTTNSFKKLIYDLYQKDIIIMHYKHIKSMGIGADNPNEVGTDLLAATLRAKNKYSYPVIVSDLGTACKIMVVDKNCSFSGAVIYPGMLVSFLAMIGSAEKLPESVLNKTEKVIGTNTIDCMNSGTINLIYYSVIGFNNDFIKELGYPCKKILTGGYSKYIKEKFTDFIYDPDLVIEGIYDSYIEYKGGKSK